LIYRYIIKLVKQNTKSKRERGRAVRGRARHRSKARSRKDKRRGGNGGEWKREKGHIEMEPLN
jgi:hypothetical protein